MTISGCSVDASGTVLTAFALQRVKFYDVYANAEEEHALNAINSSQGCFYLIRHMQINSLLEQHHSTIRMTIQRCYMHQSRTIFRPF